MNYCINPYIKINVLQCESSVYISIILLHHPYLELTYKDSG